MALSLCLFHDVQDQLRKRGTKGVSAGITKICSYILGTAAAATLGRGKRNRKVP